MTWLWILIGIAIGFVGLIVALWLLLRVGLPWYLKRKLAGMADMSSALAARITLKPFEGGWQQDDTASLVESMESVGFVRIGCYEVPEMAGMRLWVGALPQSSICTAVYDHTSLPPFFDVVRVYDSLQTDTVTSTRLHDPGNVVPGNTCHADPDLHPAAALSLLQGLPVRSQERHIDSSNFVAVFTELYARSMDHILARQMPDAEHMRRVGQRMADATGEPMPELDDAQMQQAIELQRSSMLAALETAIVDNFLQSGHISAHDWENAREKLRIVHVRYRPDEVINTALFATDWSCEDEQFADLVDAQLPVFELFAAVEARLADGQRLRLLGEVDSPLQARLYCAP